MKEHGGSPLDGIDDYVRGGGSDEEVEAFEDELFARALERRAPELSSYDALVATLRSLAERGTIENFITAAQAAEMRARYGDRLAYLELSDAATQTVVVPASADFVLTPIPVDLGDADRLDLEVLIQGHHIKTMPDVQFERAAGALYLCCEGSLARQAVGFSVVTRYFVHGREGRRLLGESLVHTELGA